MLKGQDSIEYAFLCANALHLVAAISLYARNKHIIIASVSPADLIKWIPGW